MLGNEYYSTVSEKEKKIAHAQHVKRHGINDEREYTNNGFRRVPGGDDRWREDRGSRATISTYTYIYCIRVCCGNYVGAIRNNLKKNHWTNSKSFKTFKVSTRILTITTCIIIYKR